MLRTLGLLLLLVGTLHADVLVLKGGSRVSGRVSEKTEHYEVTVDGVLRTYLKDEVEKVVTSPKEFLGDADKLVEQARADYQKAVAERDPAAQNVILKAAIDKVKQAREAYGVALDLFPDDGSLGKQIMIIMQLMRLLRERVHLDETRLPGSPPEMHRATALPVITHDDALTTLLDSAKRNEPARRMAALATFKRQGTDFGTAAALFLSTNEPKGVQEYFDGPWLRQPLNGPGHLEAAKAISKVAAGREALLPFAIVHLGAAPQEAETDSVAKSLGLMVQNGIVGTPEGHAVRDLDNWIAHGEFDLAVLAFINEFRAIDTPAVRFVWSYALLRLVQARKRGFDRPANAYETVKISVAGGPEHIAALSKSIKAVSVCNVCGGEGRFRCTNCHGKTETRILCERCKGRGHIVSSGGGARINCPSCLAKGVVKVLKCEKCAKGYIDCKQCDKPKPPPSMEDIVDATVCSACEGRGMAFRNAALPCRACLGLGAKLIPKADPAKVLP